MKTHCQSATTSQQPHPDTTEQTVVTVAQPDRYDVMNAPVYVPPPATFARPGSDAFLACQSRGHRC